LHEIEVSPANACGGLNSNPSADGCFQPSWSPDGKKIVFAKGKSGDFNAEIYMVDADGTGLTQITHGGVGAENPDWGTHPLEVKAA
jgi:Tol biopolymer transport system component